jgi:hypothetical protein
MTDDTSPRSARPPSIRKTEEGLAGNAATGCDVTSLVEKGVLKGA